MTNPETAATSTTSIPKLTLVLKDKAALYASYMPFIQGGAFFVPGNFNYALGVDVTLEVRLLEEAAPFIMKGRVVWITPRGAQGGRAAGVGVQIFDANADFMKKVETHLAGSEKSDRATHTL